MEEEPAGGPPSPGPAALPLLPPLSKNCPGFPPDRASTAAAQGRSPFPTTRGLGLEAQDFVDFVEGQPAARRGQTRPPPPALTRPPPLSRPPAVLARGGHVLAYPPCPPRVAGLKPGESAFPAMPAGGEGPRRSGGSWDKGCRAPGGPKYWLRIDVSFRRGSSWYPHIPSVSLPPLLPVASGIGTCAPFCSKV